MSCMREKKKLGRIREVAKPKGVMCGGLARIGKVGRHGGGERLQLQQVQAGSNEFPGRRYRYLLPAPSFVHFQALMACMR